MNRVRKSVPSYNVLNGLAITSLLTRLQGIMEGNLKEFAEDVGLQDDDQEDHIPMAQIWKVWQMN